MNQCLACNSQNFSISRPRLSKASSTIAVASFICDDCDATYELTYQLHKVEQVNDTQDTEQQERNLADPSYRSDLMSMQGPGGFTI